MFFNKYSITICIGIAIFCIFAVFNDPSVTIRVENEFEGESFAGYRVVLKNEECYPLKIYANRDVFSGCIVLIEYFKNCKVVRDKRFVASYVTGARANEPIILKPYSQHTWVVPLSEFDNSSISNEEKDGLGVIKTCVSEISISKFGKLYSPRCIQQY